MNENKKIRRSKWCLSRNSWPAGDKYDTTKSLQEGKRRVQLTEKKKAT